jgi:hypothetical protein
MANRYPFPLLNTPGFDINDNSTQQEQEDVFSNPLFNTGINPQGFTGTDSVLTADSNVAVMVGNPGSLVVAPNQVNSGSEAQSLQLANGTNVESMVSPSDAVISSPNALINGGFGLSPNILLNLPSASGMFGGVPVWDYAPNEIIDALPAYQANRARLVDQLADVVESGEYDFFVIAIPADNADAFLTWKDTYRSQLSVPEESLLVMIMADFVDSETPPT